MRLALMRFDPFSYFWICWNVTPRSSPSLLWLMPSIARRIRNRAPTYTSTMLDTLEIISSSCPIAVPALARGITDLRERDSRHSDSAQGYNFTIGGLRLRPTLSGQRSHQEGHSDQHRPDRSQMGLQRRGERLGQFGVQNALRAKGSDRDFTAKPV